MPSQARSGDRPIAALVGDRPLVWRRVLADAILGKLDAVSFWQDWQDWWYTLLSLGLRLPIVAHLGLRPLGMQRTYARLQPGQDFSYASWIEAIRAGRTCVTLGPFLTFTVNGADPGACVELDREGDVVRIRAEAVSRKYFHELVILQDGNEIVQQQAQLDGLFHAEIDTEHRVTRSGWLAARCFGKPDAEGQSVDAHTSPVYVQVDRQPPPVDAEAAETVIGMLDRTLAWVNRYADCPTPKDRERLAKVFVEAKRVLESRRDGR